jgi:IPT/TIG domain
MRLAGAQQRRSERDTAQPTSFWHRRELASSGGRRWSRRRSHRSIVVVPLVAVAVLLSGCITSFTPTEGPSAGHTTVVINGTTFLGASSVKFGATAATWFHVTSTTKITAMTKPHAPGSVTITVVTPKGSFISSHGGFKFIPPTGPAYDSLIPLNGGDPYTQDQTFAGAFVVEFGNEIHLATSGQVTNVVVGMRNWGTAVSQLPITLTLYNPRVSLANEEVTGPGSVITSVTQDFNVPARIGATDPSAFDITFNLATQRRILPSTIVYGISFTAFGKAPALNVALSSSAKNLLVGSDTYDGYVHVKIYGSTFGGWDIDAGTCGSPKATTFVATYIYCGNVSTLNVGAYGGATNADIPAVEFNVMGAPPLP